LSRRFLAFGICFLLICSVFIPLSLGVNIKITRLEQLSNLGDSKTLYVGGSGPDNYTKIQDAIDNVSEGYTIYVFSGIYNEHILIDKEINCGTWRNQPEKLDEESDILICLGFSPGSLIEISYTKWFKVKKIYIIKEFISQKLPKEINKKLNISYLSLKELKKRLE